MRLVTLASLRHLTRHRLQTVLAVLGVALGVAVVLAIDTAIGSAREGFRISAETVAGRATHVVTSDYSTVPEDVIRALRIEWGIRAAAPVLEGFASSPDFPGRALRILGIDPFSEAPFRSFVAGGETGLDVSSFITTRRGIALSEGLLREAGLAVGDSITALVGGRLWTLPIVTSVRAADDLQRAGLADVLVMDIAGAQEVLAAVGQLTRVDLVLEGSEQVARIERALPPQARIEAVGTRSETMTGMIRAFDVNLTALSLLALIFGMFLIYNAATFSVVQRRPLLGRLRALGVTRSEIVRTILAEAVWIGVVGAGIGMVLGVVLARGLVGMISTTINDLYFAVAVRDVAVDPWLAARAGFLGVAATVVASLPPAAEAAGASPRVATMRSAIESRVRALVPRAALFGFAMAGAGGALLLVPTRSLVVSFAALFFVITGLALATPLGTVWLVRGIQPVLARLGGTLGTMASRGVEQSLSRTAPAVAALVVAVSVTVGLGVMIDSFRGSLTQWLDGTLRADIYVSLPGPRASAASGTLWPDLVEDFANHPDVAGVSTYRGSEVLRADDVFRLVALDLDPRGESAFDLLEGRHEVAMAAFREGRGAMVSEPFALRRGVGVGDEIELASPAGPFRVPISGVFRDYGNEQGTVMVGRALYDRHFDDPGVTSLGLFLADDVDSERVVRELLATVDPSRSVIVRTNDALRSASLEVFERTFAVTGVLRLLAFIVAFVGVLGALAALQLERLRELGLLRASGLTPGELWRLVVTQTGLIGFASGILAVPMGLLLSAVMVYVVNRRSFGWTLDMSVGVEVIGQAVFLAVGAALLAGLWPAWRMSRVSPAVALRSE